MTQDRGEGKIKVLGFGNSHSVEDSRAWIEAMLDAAGTSKGQRGSNPWSRSQGGLPG